MRKNARYLYSQQGLSLIEVLVSIVILFLVIITFSGFFLQSANVSKGAETKMDATYEAQKYMEEIIEMALSKNEAEGRIFVEEKWGFTEKGNNGKYVEYENTGDYYTVIGFTPAADGLSNTIVKIYKEKADVGEKIPKAQMETIVSWGGL